MSTSNVQAAAVSVSKWGELPAERTLPGCIRVLIDGQHAGGVERKRGTWVACWHTAAYGRGRSSDRITEHATAEEAVAAVVRSGWARRLGARRTSRITWTAKASRLAARGGAR